MRVSFLQSTPNCAYVHHPDLLRLGLRCGPLWEHIGYLRSVALFEDANCDQFVHSEPGARWWMLLSGHPLPNRYIRQRRLDLRDDHVQDLPDHDVHQSVHKFHFSHRDVGWPIHSRLSPYIITSLSDQCHCSSGLAHGLGNVGPADGARVHVRCYHHQAIRGPELQYILAIRRGWDREWCTSVPHPQWTNRIHVLQFLLGICSPIVANLGVLHPCDYQTENGRPQEQVERKEEIPSKSHPLGPHCDYRIYPLLAALLDYPIGINLHWARTHPG